MITANDQSSPTATDPSGTDGHDGHDDFGGLERDLPRLLGRRGALTLFAAGAVGVGLAACQSKDSKGSSSTSTNAGGSGGSTSTTAGTGSTTDQGTSGGSTSSTILEETGGPYPGDGTNGPNALTESGIVRSDITTSFGDASGKADGVPLTVKLHLVDVAGGGGPMVGAAVYAWHCTADGAYSLYTGSAQNENYLRGVQAADNRGDLTFVTIFPGAYAGRYPHIHFEVYDSVATATEAGRKLHTSQLALPEEACNTVYATAGYEQSARNFPQTSLQQDMVFSDGWSTQLATVTGDTSGMVATLNVGV